MTPQEQAAFVRAYDNHVADVPAEVVEDFVRRHCQGENIPYQTGYTSIMDALGVWHEAIKYQLTQEVEA